MDTIAFQCRVCGSSLYPTDVFCSHCGTKVEATLLRIGIGKQIWIYLVSIFLPPLGLVWTWKYLRLDNTQAKKVGIIAAILTILSLIFTIWITVGFFQAVQSQLNSYSQLGL